MTYEHPCPAPAYDKKRHAGGQLWACECGRVYVLRNNGNYAGDVWIWKHTELRVDR